MNKVKIFSDSTADLPEEVIKKYNITVMPLYVTLDGKTYKDMVDITASDIFECYNKTKTLPKTSAISVSDYVDAFSKAVNMGYEVVHFTISSEFSSCYQNACLAAEEVGHVYPIDSRNLSSGIGLLVLNAAELVAEGKTAEEISNQSKAILDKVNSSFVLGTLEFLYKGGRCSGVAALGANLLKLKPCIEVSNGKMAVGKKYRGSYEKCVEEYIKDRLEGKTDIDTKRMFFTYTGMDEKIIKEVPKMIKKYQKFNEIIINEAGSTISGHCGPCCLGILYFNK